MSLSTRWITRLMIVLALLATGVSAVYASNPGGPVKRIPPYVVRTQRGVTVKTILTVGDSVNNKPDGTPYRMVGIADGLGAFDNGDGTFTVLMNHELGTTAGIPRAHGATGAFVSRWIIRKGNLAVLSGEDLIQNIATYNPATYSYNDPAKGVALGRLCSADLPAYAAFFNPSTGLGYDGRIFMDGEEVGAEGRAFAHFMDGTSYELPWLGKFSWENSVAHPDAGDQTVVVGMDDSNNGQIYIYAGTKTDAGLPVDRAGLSNGELFGLKVGGFTAEDPASGIPSGTSFSLYNFGDVANQTGAWLEATSSANGVTGFQRPEDGAWDPTQPSDFYFVTTASFTGNSRLWRLRFNDPSNPQMGGTLDMLLNGSEGQRMMDNLTIDRHGQVFIQEDPGGQEHLARIWRYDIATDSLTQVAQHDPRRFITGAPDFLTIDEESSGIIDVSDILGEGMFLLDVQAHYNIGDTELVEGGQLLALRYLPKRR